MEQLQQFKQQQEVAISSLTVAKEAAQAAAAAANGDKQQQVEAMQRHLEEAARELKEAEELHVKQQERLESMVGQDVNGPSQAALPDARKGCAGRCLYQADSTTTQLSRHG